LGEETFINPTTQDRTNFSGEASTPERPGLPEAFLLVFRSVPLEAQKLLVSMAANKRV